MLTYILPKPGDKKRIVRLARNGLTVGITIGLDRLASEQTVAEFRGYMRKPGYTCDIATAFLVARDEAIELGLIAG